MASLVAFEADRTLTGTPPKSTSFVPETVVLQPPHTSLPYLQVRRLPYRPRPPLNAQTSLARLDRVPFDKYFVHGCHREASIPGQVCQAPQLGRDTADLERQVEAFAQWLEEEFTAPDVALPDIDVQTNLRIARYRYIKMCCDIAKHHLGRLSANVRDLRTLLRQARHDIDEQAAYLAVENFYQWFFEHIFLYHSSQVAEFLNDIRWAIYLYLQPEFDRSYHLTDEATPDFPHTATMCPTPSTSPLRGPCTGTP